MWNRGRNKRLNEPEFLLYVYIFLLLFLSNICTFWHFLLRCFHRWIKLLTVFMYIMGDTCYTVAYSPIAHIVLRKFNKLFCALLIYNKTINQHYSCFTYSDDCMCFTREKYFGYSPVSPISIWRRWQIHSSKRNRRFSLKWRTMNKISFLISSSIKYKFRRFCMFLSRSGSKAYSDVKLITQSLLHAATKCWD